METVVFSVETSFVKESFNPSAHSPENHSIPPLILRSDPVHPSDKSQYVYLLVSTSGSTYVGATVDLDHRLRQHNKEIKGGARATSMKVEQGETWQRHCYVSGFPTWQSALQFEWRWKQIHRRLPRGNPLINRMKALDILLSLDRSTSNALPYSEWTVPPQVHYC